MKITVKFFASHRDAVGKETLVLELGKNATISELIDVLSEKYPALKKLKQYTFISLNHNYANAEQKLNDGDEVALFPPVSGG